MTMVQFSRMGVRPGANPVFRSDFGIAAFPALDLPELGTGSRPAYRITVCLSEAGARDFIRDARQAFEATFPGVTAPVLPIKRNRYGTYDLRAESISQPKVLDPQAHPVTVKSGDTIRLFGALVPYSRPNGAGLNFRLFRVELQG